MPGAENPVGGLDVLSLLSPFVRGQFVGQNWDQLKGIAQNSVDLQAQQQEAQKAQLAQAIQQATLAQQAQSDYLSDPSNENLARFSVFNPKAFETIKAAHDMKRDDQQRQDLRDMSALNGMLGAGDWDGAASSIQRRIDADTKAGQDTKDDQHVLDLVKAKSPQAIALVKAQLYGALGPDKYTAAYESDPKNALAMAQAANAAAEAKKNGYLILPKDTAAVPVPGSPGLGGEAAPAAPAATGTAPRVKGPVGDAINKVVESVGAAPGEADYLHTVAMIESGGKMGAKNGSSTGAFQFHPETFRRLGGKDINDPVQQAAAALQLAREDAGALRQTLRREPVPGEVYLAHQQGLASAEALLTSAPGTKAIDAVQPYYTKKDGTPDKAMAMKAITGNGGKPNMTAEDFAKLWTDKYAAFSGASAATPGAAPAAGDGLPPGSVLNRGADGADEAALDPDSVAMIGEQYLRLGPDALKNLGQGKTGVANKSKILAWAAQQAKEAGTTNPELVARFVANKANITALNATQKNLSSITASEQTLAKNIDLARSFAKKGVGPTGLPWLDTPINRLRSANGSVDAKVYDNLLVTTANEYAKVLTTASGTGGGTTTDSARAEAQRLFNSGMTLGQFIAAADAAKAEAANRHAANAAEVARLTQAISGTPAPAPGAAAPAAAVAPKVRVWNPKTGKLE